MKLPRALTIAGSDSGGGAGIQADLKTFAALRVHGMSAITSVTAQNTVAVTAIQDLDPGIVRAQIRAVVDDIGVDVVKTGMLHTSKIIEVVVSELRRVSVPIVVDPVMISKSGARLLKPESVKSLMKDLLPLATIVTPNSEEASVLSGLRVSSIDEMKQAARKIGDEGPNAVVVKGGHVRGGSKVVDVLYYRGKIRCYESPRLSSKCDHGTGCSFASAVAANLAKRSDIPEAVEGAKKFIQRAIAGGIEVGQGHGPVNPMAHLYIEAERYDIITRVKNAAELLESESNTGLLVPESQMNLGMALPMANDVEDVAAIPGRIVRIGKKVRASSAPDFGASQHVAKTILVAMRHDPTMRAALNMKFSPGIVGACKRLGMTVSSYDRKLEPKDLKKIEGMTIEWGVAGAIAKADKVPDIVFHKGDFGKEPMITVLGTSPIQVVEKGLSILREYLKRENQ